MRTLLFSGLMLAVPASNAGEDVDERKDVPDDALVRIENTRGEVDITAWSESAVSVSGELDDLAEELRFTVDGDTVTIEVVLPRKSVNWGDGSDLEIHVPEGARVMFSGVSTDVTVNGVAGGVNVQTVSGDVEVEDVSALIRIKTVSGDIDVDDSAGQTSVATVSGDVDIEVSSDKVSLDTVSGDLDASVGEFASLNATAVSGDLHISGRLIDDGRVDISSVSSDVRLELDTPVNARLKVETGPGGDIYNMLSDHPVEERFPP